MIRKSDVQWWVLEAKKDPESAPGIIEALADRLAELDAENERLRDELIQLQRGAPPSAAAAEGAEIGALQRKVETLQTILKGQASTEVAAVIVSDHGGAARMPLSQVRLRLRERRPALARSAVLEVRSLLLARPQDDLLLLTNQGRFIKLLLHKIPFLVDEDTWPEADESGLAAGEQVAATAAVGKPPRFWAVITRRGYARQLLHLQVDKGLGLDDLVFKSPLHNDEPVAMVDGDRGDLLLFTRWGKAVRFPQRTISPQGSVAIEVEPDDEVVAAVPLPTDAEVVVLTAAGYAMRRETARLRAQTKPGGAGKMYIQAYDVLGAFPFAARGKLLYLTYSGRFAAVETVKIPLQGRAGKGARVHDMSRDPAVAVAMVPGALL
jgi:DNA gyrase/topoisomerase IV subunit A